VADTLIDAATPVAAARAPESSWRDCAAGYLFLAPWLIGFFGLTLGPALVSLYLSFTDYDLLSNPRWVGAANYVRIATSDPKFSAAMHVTFLYVALAVPFKLTFALLVAMILNQSLRGLPLYRAREAVLERINTEQSLYNALRRRALQLATSTFSDLPDDRPMYVEGASSLLDDATGLTVQTLQALLQMIEEKQKLLELLNEYIDGPGLTVVIGAEHLDPSLRPFSLVLSTYDDGSGIGTVGVIGPTRMHYSRAIAAVDGAAQAVSRLLREPN